MSIITLHEHFLRICNFLLSTQNIIYYSLLQIILFCYSGREIRRDILIIIPVEIKLDVQYFLVLSLLLEIDK